MSGTILNCQGLPCPEPVLLTKRYLEQHTPHSITVTVDNEAANENVSRFLQSQHYSVVSHNTHDGLWLLQATRQEGAQVHESTAMQSTLPQTDSGKKLIIITSPTIGKGDDTLGASLMKNFLSTLPELGTTLWRIILLNGGVTLSVNSSPVLAELQRLEAAGISILVCGSCLNHYNLLKEKAVGQTTNMLDVVTSIQLASSTIHI